MPLDLETVWFAIIVAAMIGYAVLDGFDLGVGMLHPFVKKDHDRRIFLNAIGPVWDGNEVWLIIVIGALFAGFPGAYASMFSALYEFMMILTCALIMRAVAIEFRSKRPMAWWRKLWDGVFSLGSFAIAFGLGIALGNLIQGIPIDKEGNFVGQFTDLVHPYPVAVGVLTVALFLMHGAIFLVMKTEGELHHRVKGWVTPAIILFILCYGAVTMATLIYMPHMVERIKEHPWTFAIAFFGMLAIANIPREVAQGRDGRAFASSCVAIGTLLILYAIGVFPHLLRSSLSPEYSVTIYNSHATDFTLSLLLVIVAIGLPLVLAYGFIIYRVFRGRVKISSHSY